MKVKVRLYWNLDLRAGHLIVATLSTQTVFFFISRCDSTKTFFKLSQKKLILTQNCIFWPQKGEFGTLMTSMRIVIYWWSWQRWGWWENLSSLSKAREIREGKQIRRSTLTSIHCCLLCNAFHIFHNFHFLLRVSKIIFSWNSTSLEIIESKGNPKLTLHHFIVVVYTQCNFTTAAVAMCRQEMIWRTVFGSPNHLVLSVFRIS